MNFLQSCASQSDLSARALQEAEAESESDYEKEPEPLIRKDQSKMQRSAMVKVKQRVVSKPLLRSTYLLGRRPRTPKPSLDGCEDSEEEDAPLKETCIKIIAEMRQNGLKIIPDAKSDALQQFPNCKLENSIINETLNNAKSAISPPKQIHNTYITMNTSS